MAALVSILLVALEFLLVPLALAALVLVVVGERRWAYKAGCGYRYCNARFAKHGVLLVVEVTLLVQAVCRSKCP
ncbi:MAG TPA: hypothetical protein VJ690_10075 [Burkholderiales bacterium]|nr:hypothetical protein [Burkholderiales bacterium]